MLASEKHSERELSWKPDIKIIPGCALCSFVFDFSFFYNHCMAHKEHCTWNQSARMWAHLCHQLSAGAVRLMLWRCVLWHHRNQHLSHGQMPYPPSSPRVSAHVAAWVPTAGYSCTLLAGPLSHLTYVFTFWPQTQPCALLQSNYWSSVRWNSCVVKCVAKHLAGSEKMEIDLYPRLAHIQIFF